VQSKVSQVGSQHREKRPADSAGLT